jgi:hypothetical protein
LFCGRFRDGIPDTSQRARSAERRFDRPNRPVDFEIGNVVATTSTRAARDNIHTTS